VRKGYFTAFQALKTSQYHQGAYITGQPGIGESWTTLSTLHLKLSPL